MRRGTPPKPLEHGADLVAGEDDRESFGALGADDTIQPGKVDFQHVPVKEQEGAERLVLGSKRRHRPSTASDVRSAVTSGPPRSIGWRLPWKKKL